jgi:hypothetical protein
MRRGPGLGGSPSAHSSTSFMLSFLRSDFCGGITLNDRF